MLSALVEAIKNLLSMTKASRLVAVLTAYTAMIFASRLNLKAVVNLLRRTVEEWGKDGAAGWAAGLAYYAIFSLAPALIIVIAIAGLVFGEEEVQQQIVAQVETAVGKASADLVQTMIEGLREQQRSGVAATVVGVVTLVLGSIGAFGHLHGALNAIWGMHLEVRSGLGSVLFFVKRSVLSFAIVASAAFLLVLFVILNSALSVLRNYLAGVSPEVGSVLPAPNLFVSLIAITVLFAIIYRYLPDVDIRWRDVWLGAFLTAWLFILGQFFIGLYLGTSSIASIYGAAGSIIAILLWVYYSAQIFMLGAEFVKVYTRTYGSHRDLASPTDVPVKQPKKRPPKRRRKSRQDVSGKLPGS